MNKRSFDTFKERFGYELEKLRRIHRIKQCDLAKHINITQSTLSNLERGKNDITLEMFLKLFDVFGSVIIYVALLAYFNVNINEKIKNDYPQEAHALFRLWVDYLRNKGEAIVFQTHYEDDKTRVD